MYLINYDEAEEIIEKIDFIKALKYVRDIGYSLKNKAVSISMNNCDLIYFKERAIESVLEMMVGEGSYMIYQGTTEDGQDVGYNLYYDEDELTVNVLRIHSEHIMKYLKILKKHGIEPYSDGKLADHVDKLKSNEWGNDYDMTEGMIGLDYSGIYMLTTYYTLDYTDFIDAIDDILTLCKKRVMDYNQGLEIELVNYKGIITTLKKPKKKRRRSWESRDIWKSKLIEKNMRNTNGGYSNAT